MEYKLKSISREGIAEATAKIELYRYLNEPEEAESICRDILAVEPGHQAALRLLGLAITDQFLGVASDRHQEAKVFFQQLSDPYERVYYTGILYERWGKMQLRTGHPPYMLLPLFEKALECFGEAQKLRPAGNDNAVLRWNCCVRLLQTQRWSGEAAAFETGGTPPLN